MAGFKRVGVGPRFGSKIVISISRYGRKITRLTYLSVEKKTTHQVIVGVIVFLMLIRSP